MNLSEWSTSMKLEGISASQKKLKPRYENIHDKGTLINPLFLVALNIKV